MGGSAAASSRASFVSTWSTMFASGSFTRCLLQVECQLWAALAPFTSSTTTTLSPDGTLKDGIDGFVKTGVKETFFVNKEKSEDGNRHRVAPEEGPKKVEEGVCVEETITVDLQSLLDKFVKEDCPKLMETLELPDEPIPLWWTADFINGSKGECWKPAE